ncbi:DUF1232 domain-containing protein [Halobacteriales archaeon Cl-PHB]
MVGSRLAALLRRGYALTLAVRDQRVPRSAKVVAVLALAWVVVPVDFDFVPVVGWVDDAVVVLTAFRVVEHLAPAAVVADLEDQSPRTLRRVAAVVLLLAAVVVGASTAVVWWVFLA